MSNLNPNPRPVAVVTGASRGLGAAIAKALGKANFHVVVNYTSNESKATEVVGQIIADGGAASAQRFSVSSSTEVDASFDQIIKAHGNIAVLVNNAGITIDGLLMRMKDEDLDKTLNVDLKGAIYCTRAASKSMLRNKKGSIIHISSVIGEMGNAGQSAYAAAKSGLIGFSKSVARELASRQIRSNVVTPGYIQTDMTESLTQEQKEGILRNIPLGTMGQPEDIASLVKFLALDDSRYITGQVIGVNGGMYL